VTVGTHHPYGPSKLERLAACPGSHQLSAGKEGRSSPDADEGTMLHARSVTGDVGGLDPEQRECVRIARASMEVIAPVSEWRQEVHMSALRADGLDILTEGTCDAILIRGNVGWIQDRKFGRGEVAKAPDNWQGAGYALCAHDMYGLDEVNVLFVQPRVHPSEQVVYHTFTQWESIRARIAIVVRQCEECNPEFRAGPHCRYCPAALRCSVLRLPVPAVDDVATIPDPFDVTDPVVMARFLEARDLAGITAKRIEEWRAAIGEAASIMLANGTPVQGWTRRETLLPRECIDLAAAFGSVKDAIPQERFLACCKLSLPALETEYAAARPDVSKAAAKRLLADLLGELVTRAPGKGQVVRE
jgi:hypothetical protein